MTSSAAVTETYVDPDQCIVTFHGTRGADGAVDWAHALTTNNTHSPVSRCGVPSS